MGDRRVEGNCLLNMSILLDGIDQRTKAIELAKLALKIYEQIDKPIAEQVLQLLEVWQK